MQTLTFRVPDADVPRLLQLVETIPAIERVEARNVEQGVEEPDTDEYRPKTKEEIKAGIRDAWDELIEVRAGRKEARLASEVLEEIKRELGQ